MVGLCEIVANSDALLVFVCNATHLMQLLAKLDAEHAVLFIDDTDGLLPLLQSHPMAK
jgi:hypothetical protein